MPYNPWNQFRRQRVALGLIGSAMASSGSYPPPTPRHWANHTRFPRSQNARVSLLTGMQPNPEDVIEIQTNPTPPAIPTPAEILSAVRDFGGYIQTFFGLIPPLVEPSVVGTVIYDIVHDQLYYGVSGIPFHLPLHADITGRFQVIENHPHQVNGSLIPNGRPPDACAEVRALNWALHSGAIEDNLDVWTFRINDMRPLPRCPNCEISVPSHRYRRIWTA